MIARLLCRITGHDWVHHFELIERDDGTTRLRMSGQATCRRCHRFWSWP